MNDFGYTLPQLRVSFKSGGGGRHERVGLGSGWVECLPGRHKALGDMVTHTITPVLGRQKQEDQKSRSSLLPSVLPGLHEWGKQTYKTKLPTVRSFL